MIETSSSSVTEVREAVLSTLKGELKDNGDGKTVKVKELRKAVLISLQLDKDDKASKRAFKKAVQVLEADGELKLDSEGNISMKNKRKKDKEAKKKSKKAKIDSDLDETGPSSPRKKAKKDDESDDDGEEDENKGKANSQSVSQNETSSSRGDTGTTGKKNSPCKGNPQGVTRLFVGNLPFAVDENSLEDFIPGVTHVKWITDKETGKFYGSAFVEMEDSTKASDAVAKAGSKLLGRPIKVNFAPARPGDVWPPQKKAVSGGSGQAGGQGKKAMGEKPAGCKKLFIGNLSYDIDDDQIWKFFGNVDAEVRAVRWLHHKDSGDFKGCGYVEFWNAEACDKAATLNGKSLLGRPIRIDWTD